VKRIGRLWDAFATFDNLLLAFRKARKGKRRRPDVALFELNLERELLTLKEDLGAESYKPGPYRLFTIYERKPRQIAAASFRDRVVHHALLNVVEPWLDRRFINDSYACRKGRGVHRAVARYQSWSQRYAYTLKLDVARYFPSVDHILLRGQLRRHLKDRRILRLFDQIIDGSPPFPDAAITYFYGDDLFSPLERRTGIPIGNLTSQFLANLYLNEIDHFIKQELEVKAYLRYVDDLILLSDHKCELHAWRRAIEERMQTLRLRIHPRKAEVYRVVDGVDVLGYRVFPGYRLLRNDNGHRFNRRLLRMANGYRTGELDWDDFDPAVQSWIGHASQADTLGLRTRLFDSIVFTRERG